MPKKTKKITVISRTFAALALGLLVAYTSYPGVKTAFAAPSCSTIAECTNQINASNAAVKDLKNQAISYQDAVTRLQSQINLVQGQIRDSQVQQADLERQITDAQNQINSQKSILGEDLRTMYIDGQMSTIEALATSNNLSDYVDKEEYRTAVQNSIQVSLGRIAKLQAQLQTQRQQVASLLSQQRSQAAQLSSDRAQQAELLNFNKSQQSAYNAQTSANQAKLSALIAAQRTANNGTSSGGLAFIRFPGEVRDFNPNAYPYADKDFGMSTAPGCTDNDGPDEWGYCYRQCVSFTAWAVKASGRGDVVPRYWGNAKNWDDRARAAGIPVYSSPQPGDIAVSNSGTWGHVMYVEAVSGDKMHVWEYNQQLNGKLRTDRWISWQ